MYILAQSGIGPIAAIVMGALIENNSTLKCVCIYIYMYIPA